MKLTTREFSDKSSSALVITLLGVAMLTIIVIAFMQTMSLALVNAKSYSDQRQAACAAEAGMEMAINQLQQATGTNISFVTGLTNYPDTNYPVTVIGMRNLTNGAQLMPLVSGPTNLLSGFGQPGWANFEAYISARTNASLSVDLNTTRQFIQKTSNDKPYRAYWVTMTNVMGTQKTYTRFAYLVLDDNARINPTLATGAGTGLSNTTNWYSGGPQDLSMTNALAQLLTPTQQAQITAATNSFRYSDDTLGLTFANRSAYELVKHQFTSQTNASYDVIPGWMADGGKPKYNINDLSTNSIYGATAMDRAENIATIITRNLANFHKRDPALKDSNHKDLYVRRLAANIVAYVSPDGVFPMTEKTDNTYAVCPQGGGVFPLMFAERIWIVSGGTGNSNVQIATQFWVHVWNPLTVPLTINSASLHVWNRNNFEFGTAPVLLAPDYNQPITYGQGVTIRPNEFFSLGFGVQNLPLISASTQQSVNAVSKGTGNNQTLQYALIINGRTICQTMGADAGKTALGGGLRRQDATIPANNANTWQVNVLPRGAVLDPVTGGPVGTQVSDPRFNSYYGLDWYIYKLDSVYTSTSWNGRDAHGGGSSLYWNINVLWPNRDHVPRSRLPNVGNKPADASILPSQVSSVYAAANSSAAPFYFRNAPMASIGELAHIADPAHAADDLTTISGPTFDFDSNFVTPFQSGGARSLRIGFPEFQGTGDYNWDVSGRRAIELLDLFTVNRTNLVTGGAVGRVNPNTASPEVLAGMLAGIRVNSDTGFASRTLANPTGMASMIVTNRPYSSLSDLYKVVPMFNVAANYNPAMPTVTAMAGTQIDTLNRVRQEAFGKLVQHFTVQSRSYRVYAIGQVLDPTQKPRGTVVLEAGVRLNYDQANNKYSPVVTYVRFPK